VEPVFGEDVYLTNGAFLYRVIRGGATSEGELVELEDCYGLDVISISLRELHARRLRVVVPAEESLDPR
jgi:hypothetical protein